MASYPETEPTRIRPKFVPTSSGIDLDALSDLIDVSLSSPAAGESLVFDGAFWTNQLISGSGSDLATIRHHMWLA